MVNERTGGLRRLGAGLLTALTGWLMLVGSVPKAAGGCLGPGAAVAGVQSRKAPQAVFTARDDSDGQAAPSPGEKGDQHSRKAQAGPDKDGTAPKGPPDAAPLSPFVPSERIEAGQTVDFPHDI
jgi:hypothetical protein